MTLAKIPESFQKKLSMYLEIFRILYIARMPGIC